MTPSNTSTETTRRIVWIALLAASSIAFSLIFACATPFVALATLCALNLRRRDAFALILIVWLLNQVIGYGVLGYPRTFGSFAWGAALGAAALLATWSALAVGAGPLRRGPVLAAIVAFGASFACYELALYAASFVLPGGDTAFSGAIIWYILEVNAIAFAGLIALAFGASAIGLAKTPGTIAGGAH